MWRVGKGVASGEGCGGWGRMGKGGERVWRVRKGVEGEEGCEECGG